MEYSHLIRETIGFPGRMISGSKSGYHNKYPNHIVIFNANLCTESEGKIWFGDLDLTLDKEHLSELAVALNQDLYVLRELDARFENEDSPLLKNAVIIFKTDGSWEVGKNTVYRNMIDPTNLTDTRND